MKLALVGASHIHSPGVVDRLDERGDVAVLAVWDPDAAIASKYAEQLRCPAVSDVASALAVPGLDAVVVLSQTSRHGALVEEICAAGKHCFVEKPLGLGLADAARMQ